MSPQPIIFGRAGRRPKRAPGFPDVERQRLITEFIAAGRMTILPPIYEVENKALPLIRTVQDARDALATLNVSATRGTGATWKIEGQMVHWRRLVSIANVRLRHAMEGARA